MQSKWLFFLFPYDQQSSIETISCCLISFQQKIIILVNANLRTRKEDLYANDYATSICISVSFMWAGISFPSETVQIDKMKKNYFRNEQNFNVFIDYILRRVKHMPIEFALSYVNFSPLLFSCLSSKILCGSRKIIYSDLIGLFCTF